MSPNDDPTADGAPEPPAESHETGTPATPEAGSPTPVDDDPHASSPAGGGRSSRVTWIVAAVGIVIALAVIGRPLISGALDRRPEVVGSNTKVGVSNTATILAEDQRVCSPGVYVPDDATKLQIYPGAADPGTRRIRVTVRDGDRGRVLVRRTIVVPRPDVPTAVDLGSAATTEGRVCFTNVGRRDVSLANREDTGETYQGKAGIPRVDVLTADSPRTIALVPDAIDRAGLFKGDLVGPWLIVLLGVLAGATLIWAVVSVLRDTADDDGEHR